MRGRELQLGGAYSRMAPRYPVSLPCVLLHQSEARLFRRSSEILIPAEIAEISVTGMFLTVRSSEDISRYVVGRAVTFRLHGLDGGFNIRHLHVSQRCLRMGGEFARLAPDLERLLHATIADAGSR